MSEKVALITGVTGQDGALLAELLLDKGYVVHGVKRRSSSFNTARMDHLYQDPHDAQRAIDPALRRHDRCDKPRSASSRRRQPTRSTISRRKAMSRSVSRRRNTPPMPMHSARCGCSRRSASSASSERVRFYQASTSELYGKVAGDAADARRRHSIRVQPYAAAKLYAYWITVNYREAYGFHASNGILFNHEGPTRGETFVTRKITRAVAAIELGLQQKLYPRQSRRRARLGPCPRLSSKACG